MTPAEKQAVQYVKIHLEAARQAIKVSKSKIFREVDAELKEMVGKLKDGGDVC